MGAETPLIQQHDNEMFRGEDRLVSQFTGCLTESHCNPPD